MKQFFSLLLLLIFANLSAQQAKTVDFKTAKGEVSFQPKEEKVEGKITYTFQILQNTDTVYLDARNMKAGLAKKKSFVPKLEVTKDKIYFIYPFKAEKEYTITLNYQVQHPKKALYFVGWQTDSHPQIWTQGQGKDNSHWFPSLDDNIDKIRFDITYRVPKGFQAVGNGKLITHKTTKTQEQWRYKMNHPISSYLLAVAVGKYEERELQSASGIPIQLFYEKQFSANYEPTYRYSQKIFDFLEHRIGVRYPFENYKMVPVRDFLYAGMENASVTLFSERFLVDSIGFTDRNFVNVNAHELTHHWFGDFVTEESPKEHWLHEGFASYYALLVEKEIFGDDYFYFKLYESAEKLKEASDRGKGQSLVNPKASSLTFYEKGAWALHILNTQIGDEAFQKGIQSFLTSYGFKTATVKDFIRIMEETSGVNLDNFVADWLKQSAFQDQEALEALKESDFITRYMKLVSLRSKSVQNKYDNLNKALDFPVNPYLGQEAVHQLAEEKPSSQRLQLYKKAFKTNHTLVRQAIATSLSDIPNSLQHEYEGLLHDDSYLTQEKALFNLWRNFPDRAATYLDELKETRGFYDQNIRTLWLTLSLATPSYHPEKKESYYRELAGYTAPELDYSIRQNAFGFLYQINRFTEKNYADLMQATTHPAWQFKKFGRELLRELLKEDRHRKALLKLKPQLNTEELKILKKYLN